MGYIENETAAPSAIGGGGEGNASASGRLPYHRPVRVARRAAGEEILRDIARREEARWLLRAPRMDPYFGSSFDVLAYDMFWAPLHWQGRIVRRVIELWPIAWLRRLIEVATDLVKRKEAGG